jgi:hypothetical protein
MATKTKIDNFFEQRRREVRLQHWQHLRTAAPESADRIKLALSMPLLNNPIVGAHKDVRIGYEAMEKDGCTIKRSKLDIFLEGMTLDIFDLPLSDQRRLAAEDEKPTFSVAGAKFDNFAIVSTGEGSKRTIDLQFTVYMPGTKRLMNYCWDHNHMAFFIESVYTQTEMKFDEDKDGTDEDEKEESGSDEPAADAEEALVDPVEKPESVSGKKSGPKELADFHAKEVGKKSPPKKKSAKKK